MCVIQAHQCSVSFMTSSQWRLHFLIVYECIAGCAAGVFLYRDSKGIVTVLIHSRHVEMAAGIHGGVQCARQRQRIILFLVGRIACCVRSRQQFSPTAWNRCQYSELLVIYARLYWYCLTCVWGKKLCVRIQAYISLKQKEKKNGIKFGNAGVSTYFLGPAN